MIGLSLSFCVRDLVEGKVGMAEVEVIFTNATYRNMREWGEVLKHYKAMFWRENPELAAQMAERLRRNCKIVQAGHVGHPVWVERLEEIQFWVTPHDSTPE